MLRHILRRLLLAIPTLLAVITIIFVLVRVIPGDPAVAALGDQASEQAVEQLREQLGLNKPIWQQYIDYMSGLLTGDFGNSMISRAPAWDQIQSVLPHSLELAFAAILIALLVSSPRSSKTPGSTTLGEWCRWRVCRHRRSTLVFC